MGRNRFIDRWKPVREDIDVEYNLRKLRMFTFFFASSFTGKTFSIAQFCLLKKVLLRQKKGHLFAASFVIVDGKSSVL